MFSSPSASRAATAALAVFALAASAGPPAALENAPAPGAFSFSFTAFTGFQPHLCDCPVNPLGGWAERAAVFDSLDTGATFEAGGWLDPDLSPTVASVTADAVSRLRYDVVNLGPEELGFARAGLDALEALPLVCGHPDRPAGIPAWRTLDTDAGTVGVIGAAWFGPDVIRPETQVARALAELPVVDVVVVLVAGDMGAANLAASADPRIDLVLYGGGARTPAPVPLHDAYGFAPGSKGRYVGVVTLGDGAGAADGGPGWELVAVRPRDRVDEPLKRLALRAALRHEGPVLLREQFTYLDADSR